MLIDAYFIGQTKSEKNVQAIPQNMYRAEGDRHIPGRQKGVLSDS